MKEGLPNAPAPQKLPRLVVPAAIFAHYEHTCKLSKQLFTTRHVQTIVIDLQASADTLPGYFQDMSVGNIFPAIVNGAPQATPDVFYHIIFGLFIYSMVQLKTSLERKPLYF